MLRVKAQEGQIPPVLLDRIKANKPLLLAYLRKLEAEKYLRESINSVIQGDCLAALKQLPDNSVDLLATDPPYGYGFMGKKWDKALPNPEIWEESLRILTPGAFSFIMAAPRQDVLCRMIITLEEVGFKTGFTSLYWTYAAGFPKAHNIGKAVDRKLSAKRKVLFEKVMPDMRGNNYGQGRHRYKKVNVEYTFPETKEAKQLEGSYAGFQPKPAVEVILVVMKPLDRKTYTDQALHNGKGVTWMDDCRIPYVDKATSVKNYHCHDRGGGNDSKPQWHQKVGVQWSPEKQWKQDIERQAHEKGRFPANQLVSDNVLDDGRNHKDGTFPRQRGRTDYFGLNNFYSDRIGQIGDSGTYSRFFSLDAWVDLNLKDLPELVQHNLPYLIVPKASSREKNAGVEDIAETPTKGRDEEQDSRNVSQKGKPFKRRNIHPTVKPIQLMAYLVTMGSREDDIVLDPFAGSGSTLIAAQMLKRRFIGIELEKEYHEIAVRRLVYHANSIAKGKV